MTEVYRLGKLGGVVQEVPLSIDETKQVILRDAKLVQDARTKKLRAQVAPMLKLAGSQIGAQRLLLPSYVNDALDGVLAACQRWETDEKQSHA